MTPQDRAARVAQTMLERDAASRALGMELVEIAPGRAVIEMIVGPDHLNGHGICHGGLIFTLADSAFAFACNSYNRVVVAQSNSITYVAPGQPGERLRAEAVEVALAGRSGVYDVTVRGAGGRVVALFRGQSRQVSGQHVAEAEAPDA